MNREEAVSELIGVLLGGYSSERDISLKSGQAIFEALRAAGCRVTALDITSRDRDKIAKQIRDSGIDLAFIALHGELGEDGVIQSILEEIGIPYTGSGVESSRRALDKVTAYRIFEEHGIPVPDYQVIRSGEDVPFGHFSGRWGSPLVVKPASEGSSIGITIVRDPEQFAAALKFAGRYSSQVLVERYLSGRKASGQEASGRELTVGILGEEALPVVEIRPGNPFYDFAAKYQDGETEYIVPARLTGGITAQLQETALRAHRALDCRHFSRVDFLLDDEGQSYVLELNTIPGFTSTSLLPKAARAAGIEFPELCLRLVRMAYGKTKQT